MMEDARVENERLRDQNTALSRKVSRPKFYYLQLVYQTTVWIEWLNVCSLA